MRRAAPEPASDHRLDDVIERITAQKIPPVEEWDPDHCGEIDIRIASDGRWFHEGKEIRRPELVKLFSRILRRDDDGFVLVTPAEKLAIKVDDAPFLAVELFSEGTGPAQTLAFRTNVDDHVIADAEHPILPRKRPGDADMVAPYIRVRGGLDALISRPVYYQLAELVERKDGPDGDKLGVWSEGEFFALEKPGHG